MKNIGTAVAAFVIVLSLAALAYAGGNYKVLSFQVDNVNTNTTAKTDSVSGFTGQPLRFAFSAETNMTVTLQSTSGIGMSLSNAVTLVTTTGMTYQADVTAGQYFGNDKLVLSVHSADAENKDIEARLVYEE